MTPADNKELPMDESNEGEEVRRLLDNGFRVVLFRDGIGQYSALAVGIGKSLDDSLEAWVNHESPMDMPCTDQVFDGPNRMCGCGMSVGHALHAVTEKVILRRLPDRPQREKS